MKTPLIGLSLAALAFAGTAWAEEKGLVQPDGPQEVTRAQAQVHATAMFARMDANSDGKLDPADREARRARMFDRLDANKDGQISRDEFNAGHPLQAGGAGHGPEGMAMGTGDGHRGHHRMGGHRHGGGGHGHGGGRKGMMLLHMADANKDGAVSQAEFTDAALRRFDRADANKDGKVTREERRAAREAMRKAHHGMKRHGGGMAPPPAAQ